MLGQRQPLDRTCTPKREHFFCEKNRCAVSNYIKAMLSNSSNPELVIEELKCEMKIMLHGSVQR